MAPDDEAESGITLNVVATSVVEGNVRVTENAVVEAEADGVPKTPEELELGANVADESGLVDVGWKVDGRPGVGKKPEGES